MNHDDIVLTPKSKKQKEDELRYLRTHKRAELTESISRARSFGDLSENFEYHAARQAQAINNGKIAELEALLERAIVVDSASGDEIGLGSIVTVLDVEEEEELVFNIVDATSADPANDMISYLSPVGKALLHKRVGDAVDIALPQGQVTYRVLSLKQA